MYHDLVHLLDLCVLSYHLHNQTLIWPVDPYYEQWSSNLIKRFQFDRRQDFMRKVHSGATPTKYPDVRGPAKLHGALTSNTNLDPILYDYRYINPWRPSITRPNKEVEGWILYNTPRQITDRIVRVYLSNQDDTGAPVRMPVSPPGGAPQTGDWLYCFEGGTGGVRGARDLPAWSIMGFVLVREDDTSPAPVQNRPYDIYIVFRGSRSGDPRLGTAWRARTGNPDWVTDMNFGLGSGAVEKIPEISETGSVSPGFAHCVQTMLPGIMKCLQHIQEHKGYGPRTIHVTGHSLGAALAAHFASAVRLGMWRPKGAATPMPVAIRDWPWFALVLRPFALPVVGGKTFHEAFNYWIPSIRVFLTGDPITQEYRHYPVGQPYEITPERFNLTPEDKAKVGTGTDPRRHEPFNIRTYLIKDLQRNGWLEQPLPRGFPAEEPWKVFPNFRQLLQERIQTKGKVSEVLGDRFSVRLAMYLEVCKANTIDAHEQKWIDQLLTTCSQLMEVDVNKYLKGNVIRLVDSYEHSRTQLASNHAEFYGLCLFSSLVSKMTNSEAEYWLPQFKAMPLQ